MSKIVGVKFPYILKAQEFAAGELDVNLHQFVVVDAGQGPEIGQTIYLGKAKDGTDLPQVIRIATDKDLAKVKEQEEEARGLYDDFISKIAKHNLKMKPIAVGISLDEAKVVYYFTADGRVDFRELAKDLSRSLKKQAILKQIGPRDEAKIIGGYGRCGLPVCCATFMASSESITIEDAEAAYGMSKSANKISGVCGRLMCCIRFEENGGAIKKPFDKAQGSGPKPLKETK